MSTCQVTTGVTVYLDTHPQTGVDMAVKVGWLVGWLQLTSQLFICELKLCFMQISMGNYSQNLIFCIWKVK